MLICAIHTLQYRLLFLPPPLPPPSLSSPLHHPSSHRPGPGAEAKQKQKQVKQKDAGRDRVAATCIISPVQSKLQPSIFIPPTFYLPTYPPTLYVSPYLTIPYILPIILPVLILRYVVASTPGQLYRFHYLFLSFQVLPAAPCVRKSFAAVSAATEPHFFFSLLVTVCNLGLVVPFSNRTLPARRNPAVFPSSTVQYPYKHEIGTVPAIFLSRTGGQLFLATVPYR